MAFQSAPNVAQVVLNYTCSGEKMANVFHVQMTDVQVETLAERNQVFDAFAAFWTAIKPIISNRVTLDTITLQGLEDEAMPVYQRVIGTTGSGAGGQLPNQVALVLSWQTALAGRSYRGRTYLPPLDKNGTTSTTSQPDSTTLTTAEAAGEGLVTALNTAANPLCILSRVHNKVKRDFATNQAVTNCRVGNQLDTQRRRKAKIETYTG